jgi:hypothetical protein
MVVVLAAKMLGTVLTAGLLPAGEAPGPCDVECEIRTSSRLLTRGETRLAVERLIEARQRFPEDRRIMMLMAR